MMNHHHTTPPLLYTRTSRQRPTGNVARQIGALFVMIGITALLLWFIE